MAQRVSKQGKRPAREPTDGATKAASAMTAADLSARLAAMAAERDAALAELAAARAQITALEAARSQAVNRIDWIIDSLKTVIEGER